MPTDHLPIILFVLGGLAVLGWLPSSACSGRRGRPCPTAASPFCRPGNARRSQGSCASCRPAAISARRSGSPSCLPSLLAIPARARPRSTASPPSPSTSWSWTSPRVTPALSSSSMIVHTIVQTVATATPWSMPRYAPPASRSSASDRVSRWTLASTCKHPPPRSSRRRRRPQAEVRVIDLPATDAAGS